MVTELAKTQIKRQIVAKINRLAINEVRFWQFRNSPHLELFPYLALMAPAMQAETLKACIPLHDY